MHRTVRFSGDVVIDAHELQRQLEITGRTDLGVPPCSWENGGLRQVEPRGRMK